MQTMDAIDRQLVTLLLANGRLSYSDLAEQVSLSASQCQRRVRSLEERGAITGYTAVLGSAVLGYPIDVFVSVQLRIDDSSTIAAFEREVAAIDEVVECHCILGESDYILRVVARDLDGFQRLHADVLGRLPGVMRITSHVRARAIKEQSHPPLPPASRRVSSRRSG